MKRNNCRLCHGKELNLVLNLTSTPPANEFVKTKIKQDQFPLDLYHCLKCNHYQLLDVVSPSRLFENYVYVSGTSVNFVNHFKELAAHLIKLTNIKSEDLIIDIGSNDGTLLKKFRELGCTYVLGIDPAKEIAAKASSEKIPTIARFFTPELAKGILKYFGKAKIITCNNCFAHIDDLDSVVEGVKTLLSDDGMFVFEVGYFKDIVEKCLFDNIYHEHLSQHTLAPLKKFFERHHLSLFDYEPIQSHGGSIRCFVRNNSQYPCSDRLLEAIQLEKELPIKLQLLNNKIETLKHNLLFRIREIKNQGKKIYCYGAPAKSTTFLHHFNLGRDVIDKMIDDSPWKQGLLTPGKHIPITDQSVLYSEKPDFVIISAWNFAESIIKNHPQFKEQGGTWIVPLPELMEI